MQWTFNQSLQSYDLLLRRVCVHVHFIQKVLLILVNHSWNKYRKKEKGKKTKKWKTNKNKKHKIRPQCELTSLETHSFYTSGKFYLRYTFLASTTGFILAPRDAQTACKRQRGSCFWLATDVPVWHEKVSYGTFTCNEPIMYPKILKHGLPALRLECMVLSRFAMYYRVFTLYTSLVRQWLCQF